jgi:hypothetical protein
VILKTSQKGHGHGHWHFWATRARARDFCGFCRAHGPWKKVFFFPFLFPKKLTFFGFLTGVAATNFQFFFLFIV